MRAVWGIVVAAGRGMRFGARKQFAVLGDARVVDHAVATAQLACDAVIVVLPDRTAWDGAPVEGTATGGATRADSVRAGLALVPPDAEIVVVHDAARPFASLGLFEAVIAAVRDGADGAVPGVAIVDTLKRVDASHVVATVDRDDLVAVQTPQAFRAGVLRAAHADGADASDDAALVEAIGARVVVVPGEAANVKITIPADVQLADRTST